jgi:acyltransferase
MVSTGSDAVQTARRSGPDQLKALLLGLVIFGHTFSAGVPDDAAKWMLYGFHMPAFLFLSGWLLPAMRLQSRSTWELIRHYWSRMVAAWLGVSLLYLAVNQPESFGSFPRLVRDLFFRPEFHLWYVPALFGAVLVARLLIASPPGRIGLLAIAVGGYLLWRTPLDVLLPDVLIRNVDERYLGFLIWFVLGLYARNGWLQLPGRRLAASLILAGGLLYAVAFEFRGWYSPVGFLMLNLGLVSLVPWIVQRLDRPLPHLGRSLETVGRNSLWVYLLHPFVTDLFRDADLSVPVERVAGVALTVVILAVAAQFFRTTAALRRSATST